MVPPQYNLMYKFFVIPNITPGAYFRWGRGRGAYTRKKFSVSKFIHKRSGACFRVVVVVGGGGGLILGILRYLRFVSILLIHRQYWFPKIVNNVTLSKPSLNYVKCNIKYASARIWNKRNWNDNLEREPSITVICFIYI